MQPSAWRSSASGNATCRAAGRQIIECNISTWSDAERDSLSAPGLDARRGERELCRSNVPVPFMQVGLVHRVVTTGARMGRRGLPRRGLWDRDHCLNGSARVESTDIAVRSASENKSQISSTGSRTAGQRLIEKVLSSSNERRSGSKISSSYNFPLSGLRARANFSRAAEKRQRAQ